MKFITFFSSLLVLLKYCLVGQLTATIQKVYKRGTALCVELLCEAGHDSQPEANGKYLGNIITAASVVFSGGAFDQFKSIANILKLQLISSSTFYELQRKCVYPSIIKVYKDYRNKIIENCKESHFIEISGDGRCDSPGHSAKYGTVMDQETSKIIHFHVVTVNETENSNMD